MNLDLYEGVLYEGVQELTQSVRPDLHGFQKTTGLESIKSPVCTGIFDHFSSLTDL